MAKTKEEREKEKRKGRRVHRILVSLGIIFFFVAIILMSHMNEECRENTYSSYQITGIYSASAGGFLANDICIYYTTSGQKRLPCYYDIGDIVYPNCFW